MVVPTEWLSGGSQIVIMTKYWYGESGGVSAITPLIVAPVISLVAACAVHRRLKRSIPNVDSLHSSLPRPLHSIRYCLSCLGIDFRFAVVNRLDIYRSSSVRRDRFLPGIQRGFDVFLRTTDSNKRLPHPLSVHDSILQRSVFHRFRQLPTMMLWDPVETRFRVAVTMQTISVNDCLQDSPKFRWVKIFLYLNRTLRQHVLLSLSNRLTT